MLLYENKGAVRSLVTPHPLATGDDGREFQGRIMLGTQSWRASDSRVRRQGSPHAAIGVATLAYESHQVFCCS